jgi:hypothetical protein
MKRPFPALRAFVAEAASARRWPAWLAIAVLAQSAWPAPAIADPQSELADAIKKLAGEPNYSWTSAQKTEGSETGRKQGPLEGKTEKDGITHLKVASGESSYELAFKGEKVAVKLSEDWIEPSELPVDDGRLERRLKAFKTPTKESAEFLAKAGDVKKEAGELAYSGRLTPDAAKAMFALLGKRAAEAPEAEGALKFWVKDGRLAKYELKLQGKITVGADKREVTITRTTTVEIKDVGSTKISLPESARSRLS